MLLTDMAHLFVLMLTVLGAVAAAALETAASQAPAPPVFPVRSDLVVLHALVMDRAGNQVSGLDADAFAVWEEDRRQTIQFFAREDAPVTIGLVLDISSSMYAERESVLAAVNTFGENGHPSDELFALVFDRRVRAVLPPDLPFTHDAPVLRRALVDAVAADGLTAFHDAVATGLRHLAKGSHARKALVVVGDGGDTASDSSYRELLARVETSDTTIYTVALVNPFDPFANPGRLRQLAAAGGGAASRPRSIRDVHDALRRIAADVRTAYTIAYAPSHPAGFGQHRRIRVVARARDGRALVVRTRDGYVVTKP